MSTQAAIFGVIHTLEKYEAGEAKRILFEMASTLTRERDEARAERDKEKQIREQSNRDWAEDDTAIRELVRPLGIDVDGDSFAVPPVVELVEQAIKALTASRDKLREALKGQSEFLKLLNMKLRVCYDAASRFESGTHCLISDVREVIDEKIELTAALTHEG